MKYKNIHRAPKHSTPFILPWLSRYSFRTRFDRLNSWHVFIPSTFPSRYSNGFHHRGMTWLPRERTELSMSRMYSCTTATSWRITAGHCCRKFFNFQASKLESRRYHPKGCVPLAGGNTGEHVTLIQESCPCKWV